MKGLLSDPKWYNWDLLAQGVSFLPYGGRQHRNRNRFPEERVEIRSTPANRINTLRTLQLHLIESAQLKGRIRDSVSADLKAMDREP